MIQNDSGWCKAKNSEGSEGLVPGNYIEIVQIEHAKAKYEFKPTDSNQLGFKKGDTLTIIKKDDAGW